MIDDFNADRTGWARFSDDRIMRYRLARSLAPGRAITVLGGAVFFEDDPFDFPRRVVFLMLNPSTADAFELDPTVNECRKRAIALGADVLEVVNLFAFRSPYPEDLRARRYGQRGDDDRNNAEIYSACHGAYRVIAAWGNDGALDWRAKAVTDMMVRDVRCEFFHLGLTRSGQPKHPLARGQHRIPADLAPARYEP